MSEMERNLLEGNENIIPNVNALDGAEILAEVPTPSPNDFKDGKVAPKNGIVDKNDEIVDQKLLPYTPKSQALSVGGAFVPMNLYAEINAALNKLAQVHNDIDLYVQEKLGYDTFSSLAEAFAAEQIDAIATIIFNYEQTGNAAVLADMAGMGKGRICAGVARYAYQNGLIPCFITEKPNLFSDFYRDLNDIGGFDAKNFMDFDSIGLPIPLIINSGSKDYVVNIDNKPRKKELGSNDILDPRLEYKEGDVVEPLFTAQKISELNKIFAKQVVPNDRQIVVATYSQFSGKGAENRSKFMLKNAEKFFLILDESHNAAGKSTTGAFFSSLASVSKGVLFSSATYAKRPDNFALYATRNSMKYLGTLSYIQGVIATGKDRLTEFLASGLAEQGELIRRERSFQNAKILSEGIGLKNEKGEDIVRETYKNYDDAVRGFRAVASFIKSKEYREAVEETVLKLATDNNIRLAPPYDKDEHENMDIYKARYANFYKSMNSFGEVGKNHFHFIEQLLFSLKAEGVAAIAIRELDNDNKAEEGENIVRAVSSRTGDYVKGGCKPIIAVKNTLESIFQKIGIVENVEFEKADFSRYFEYLLKSVLVSNVSFRKVIEEDDDEPMQFRDVQIDLENRQQLKDAYNALTGQLLAIKLNIPLSPLDSLIDNVQSELSRKNDPVRKGKNYICAEVSGRKTRIKRLPNGNYILTKNEVVEQNNASAFKKFNSGEVDFLIINQAGSTGASAHSSSKFKDQRPRTMLIHQIELNIQTEIQKRGRINRTGQVYYPRYVYVTSPIPSEVRRLVMFSKKMSTLDAITSANRKNSEALTNIVQEVEADNNVEGGNERQKIQIVDFINKYGWQVAEPIIEDLTQNNVELGEYFNRELMEWFNKNPDDEKKLDLVLRIMEIQDTKTQKTFFSQVTSNYIALIETLIESGEYDLDTEYRKFDAVTNKRYELSPPEGESIFQQGVYIEDAWIVADDKRLSKEQIEEKIFIGLDQGKYTERSKIQQIVKEIERSMEASVKQKTVAYWESVKSKIENAKDEEKEALMKLLNDTLKARIIDWEMDYRNAAIYVNNKAIRGNYLLPDINAQQGGQNFLTFSLGKLLRVFFSNKPNDRNYYTPAEINLEFGYLTGLTNKAIFNYAPKNYDNLNAITEVKDLRDNQLLDNWQVPKKKERVLAKFLSGNLFKAFALSEDYIGYWNSVAINRDKLRNRKDFVRFSLFKSSAIRYAIRLYSDFPNAPRLASYGLVRYVSLASDSFVKDVIENIDRRPNIYMIEKAPLFFMFDDNGNWKFLIFESLGKKRIDNPILKIDDWQEKTGLLNYWRYRDVMMALPGKERRSRLTAYICDIGNNYRNFISKEEFETCMKFIGSILKKQMRVLADEKIIEEVEKEDIFEKQLEEVVLDERNEFIYFGKNLDELRSLFDFRPLNQNFKPINNGRFFELVFENTPDINQRMAYKLQPKKITAESVVSDILLALQDSQKTEFIKMLKSMKENNAEVKDYYFKAFGKFAYRFNFEAAIFGSNLRDIEKAQLIKLGYEEAEDKLLEMAIEKREYVPPVVYDINSKNIQIYLLRLNLLLNLNS